MAEVAAAVGNGGRLMKPHLDRPLIHKDGRVKERIQPDRQSSRDEAQRRPTSSPTMMSQVVEEGTGTAAALAGIDVAGKTGTAETGAEPRVHQAWFICFAPVENPQMAVAVTDRANARARAAPSPRRSPSRCWRRCWAEAPDGRGRRATRSSTAATGSLRRIGSGGMADVYCAEDMHLGRQVAMKVLHRRFAQDQEFVERFRREA